MLCLCNSWIMANLQQHHWWFVWVFWLLLILRVFSFALCSPPKCGHCSIQARVSSIPRFLKFNSTWAHWDCYMPSSMRANFSPISSGSLWLWDSSLPWVLLGWEASAQSISFCHSWRSRPRQKRLFRALSWSCSLRWSVLSRICCFRYNLGKKTQVLWLFQDSMPSYFFNEKIKI